MTDPLLERLRTGAFTNWHLPRDEELELAVKCGFKDLIIGIPAKEQRVAKFESLYRVSMIEERLRATVDAGLVPSVMTWAVRDKAWLDSALPFMREFALWIGATPVLDAEPSKSLPCWERGSVAAEDAVVQIQEELGDLNTGWVVTGLPTLSKKVLPLAKVATQSVPQAYSIWKPGDTRHWTHSDVTFPGKMQLQAYQSWTEAVSPEQVIMGLGCYWAERPDPGVGAPVISARVNLVASVGMAVSLRCTAAWFWALDHLEHGGNRCREFFGL